MKPTFVIALLFATAANAINLNRGDSWPTPILPNAEPIDPLVYNRENPSDPV